MLRRASSRLTYASVVATLALFLALGGGAYAAFTLPPNSVRSRNIVKGQVKRADLGAGAVATGKIAKGAVTRGKIAKAEAVHKVGQSGQPQFFSNNLILWTEVFSGGLEVGFYKDQLGIVHLQGTALCVSASGNCESPTLYWIFTLPPAYRPATTQSFLVVSGNTTGEITVYGKAATSLHGRVSPVKADSSSGGGFANISLDGISFRAGA
jgi:hypothetical protein